MRIPMLLLAALALSACPAPATGGDAGAGVGSGGGGVEDGGTDGGDTDAGTGRQSLVWVWNDFPASLSAVAAHADSFTHVSPTLYHVNYDYQSGVPRFTSQSGADDFDGLTSAEVAQQIHAAGLRCTPLVFGGAANAGTDQGIHNILDDAPAGTQQAFITALVQEAQAKGYDGYNLDFEVDTGTTAYSGHGQKLLNFLSAFRSALNAQGLTLSIDLGTWYVRQSYCSGGNGVVDLTAIGAVVDQAIMMNYLTSMGPAQAACPASLPDPQVCSNDFVPTLNLMCVYVTPPGAVSIALSANPTAGNNPIAGASVDAVVAYGIRNLAVWPDWNTDGPGGSYVFLDDQGNVPATSWFELLHGFLQAP